MATRKNGKGGFTGKKGNKVSYLLNGQWVEREIGINNKPATVSQLALRQKTKICNEFLNPVKEFIDVGFKSAKTISRTNAHNNATSYNRLHAIRGEYPDQHMDFKKVLFSQGNMPLPTGVKAALTSKGISFNWSVDVDANRVSWNDHVMLMAYMPAEHDALFQINGLRRAEGSDLLKIPRYEQPVILETYLSFISANHKTICNSIYTGQFIWDSVL